MQCIERIKELLPEEVINLVEIGYKKVSYPCEEILFDPDHWSIPQHNQKYNYMFEGVPFISLTIEAKEMAESEGYEESEYPITNSIIEYNIKNGIYSQDEIEENIGGSFIDDILGQIDYPSEEQLVWKIADDKVYLLHNNTTWSRSPNFDNNNGDYLEDWVLEKSNV